jgi:hypothetical protein
MTEILQTVTLPEQIVKGAILFHNDEPFTIESVRRIHDPWTHRPALAASIGEGSELVYLILECGVCHDRAAIRYSTPMADIQWADLRWHGERYWLCPVHSTPVAEVLP